MTTWPLQRDCARFYGNPRTSAGNASPAWEREHLTSVSPPWKMTFGGKPVASCRVHKKCAESLKRIFERIWERCGRSQAEIDRIGMSIYAGGYVFRNIRGGRSLSMHSYGCAVDFDPARNGLGNKNPQMDRRVIEEFEREGWEWGGHWSRTDGMHFQAARTRSVPKRLGPARSAPSSVSKSATDEFSRDEIAWAQRRLHTLGYHEVGFVDGYIGDRTRSAIRAFQDNEGLSINGKLDRVVMGRLNVAEPRGVSAERKSVTAKDLRKTYKPVELNFRVKIWAQISAWFAALIAAINGVIEYFGDALGYLIPVRDFFGDVPVWLWFFVAAAVAFAIYLNSDEAENSTVEQVRSGEASGWSDGR